MNLTDWFPQQRMKTKREEIRNLILSLQELQSKDKKGQRDLGITQPTPQEGTEQFIRDFESVWIFHVWHAILPSQKQSRLVLKFAVFRCLSSWPPRCSVCEYESELVYTSPEWLIASHIIWRTYRTVHTVIRSFLFSIYDFSFRLLLKCMSSS